ncbi:alpha-L-rhamnosidase [Cohnella herbarum]|uniref:alpha-L-rhamnosidase n=1 Tax=Cohnella herbarum TaxID=2728023 RepID=A0A7Z2VGZ5_9BACL|nr:alpha-L-rhamnosidase [Cohnella herbarum]QJD82872.1 family 78 glycoside hydrolase catalytic domain [Cohnella herbarum]
MQLFGLTDLRCEYRVNPVGIGNRVPRFSWKLTGTGRGIKQASYRIQASEGDPLFQTLTWDSGQVRTDQSVHIPYEGSPLKSRTIYHYRVRVRDSRGAESDWLSAFWETGMMDFAEWTAHWITCDLELNNRSPEASQMFRKTFEAGESPVSARIYATALGIYELELNGKRLNENKFLPGWTSYHKRLQTQTFDVTDLVRRGDNAIGITVADGWYKGRIGGHPNNFYGDQRAALLELHLKYEDGRQEIVITDGSWRVDTGPIVMASIYDGETYDARLEKEGWSTSSYEDDDWLPVSILDHGKQMLVPEENLPTRVMRELKPIAVLRSPAGEKILDFGQNMVGWVSYSVMAPTGTIIELAHAEVLDRDGNLYTDNLRSAKQTTRYVCRGSGSEVYEPRFSFQGFRYVKVTGYPDDVSLESFTAHVIYSALDETGTFECSDESINQLQSNIVWGQRGNFLDVPTDCPQRDERLGYTGDAQVFIRTAAFNMDVASFFTKWLRDLKADQLPSGGVSNTVPDTLPGWDLHSAAGWGDAAVICPWTLYLCYGDKRLLEEQYDSMKLWVEFIRNLGEEEFLWNSGFQFGDWLALDAPAGSYAGATPKDFIATAFYAHSTDLLVKAARVLGKEKDVAEYEELHKRVLEHFNLEFVSKNGRLVSPTQTAHVLALGFGLVEGTVRTRVEQDLIELLEQSNHKLTTGFLGTPYLCSTLTDIGRTDLAYKLALSRDFPSWLYSVEQGATTIWEHWDGRNADGSFWSADMNSFNHYAFGAIGDWFYRVVSGIDTDSEQSGYKHTRIHPRPGEGLTYARASYQSMYGEILSLWTIEDGIMIIQITLPPNTTGTVILPNARQEEVTEGGMRLSESYGIRHVVPQEKDIRLELESGSYRFQYAWRL